MKLILNNKQLAPTLDFLSRVKGSGRQARSLAKFARLFKKKVNILLEERNEVFRKYAIFQEDGTLERDENGNVQFKEDKIDLANKELHDLFDDDTIIDVTEVENFFDDFVALLENAETPLNLEESESYDLLVEALERARSRKEAEEC